MAYTAPWNESIPAGSLAASDIDQAIRDAKRDIRERLVSLLGMADLNADPLAAVSLVLSSFLSVGATPAQSLNFRVPSNGGAAARNVANSADIVVWQLVSDIVNFAAGKFNVDPSTGRAEFKGHLKTTGSVPTVALGAAAGSGGTVGYTINGNDMAGTISITTGSAGVGAGLLATVTYGSAYTPTFPIVIITPAIVGVSAGIQPFVSSQTTSNFQLACNVAPATATVYAFNYLVMGI